MRKVQQAVFIIIVLLSARLVGAFRVGMTGRDNALPILVHKPSTQNGMLVVQRALASSEQDRRVQDHRVVEHRHKKEIVARIVQEDGRPVITNGKVAAIDKGSNDGISEGDLLTLRRIPRAAGTIVAMIVVVLPTKSILQIPADLSGTVILPTDVFTFSVPDVDQVLVAPQVGHSREIQSIAFSPDDSLVASGSGDGVVKVWSARDGRLLMTLKAGLSVVGIEFTRDQKRLITAAEDDHNNLRVWNLQTGRVITTLLGHSKRLNAISLSPSEPLLASSSWDGSVKLWSLDTYELRCTLEKGPEYMDLRQGLAFSSDGRSAGCAGSVGGAPAASVFPQRIILSSHKPVTDTADACGRGSRTKGDA
jgi:hypothetical protein